MDKEMEDFLRYVFCPEVYYGKTCGQGHTREMADKYIAWCYDKENGEIPE